ncbi:MAG TPA: protein translocase subunit SecD [Actinomycetota bacterium]
MSTNLGWRTFLVLVVLGGAIALILTRPVRLGLDLRGGTQIVLEARDTENVEVGGDVVDRTVEVLRRRVDALGVTEPTLQASGSRRIIIELPGVSDPDEAIRVLGRTAQLTFHRVLGVEGPQAGPSPGPSPGMDEGDEEGEIVLPDESGGELRLARAALTGEVVSDAQATIQQEFGGWTVQLRFRGEGSDAWAELTGRAACEPLGDPRRRIAIVLDDQIISSPEVDQSVVCEEGITGGETVITGNFTEDEARNLAVLIRGGALPVPVEIVEQRTVGATLGDEAIRASIQAALIGAALTILYMLVYYRLLGALAALALGAYAIIAFGALLALGATLTLPGIAGFVLAVGMAVDANVLVFERIKEEHADGRSVRASGSAGFERAWSAIADSNATTLLAAILLFFFASGAVRGFGITLSIGVVASMFSALVVTRVLVELAVRARRVRERPGLLGMGVGHRFREWLEETRPDIVSHSRRWFTVSLIALVLAGVGLAVRGLRFGVEFQGGRLVEYSTGQQVALDEVRAELADVGFPRAIVQRTGEGNVSIRTGRVTDAEEARIEQAVASLGGTVSVEREEFVGPTISGELLRAAVIALVIALALQLVYLAMRFRWTFGTSAVVAMFHDVAILLGIFAWLGKEIDGVFLASLLTVIGYSINDSVVVFDRIRERWSERSREPFGRVANDAALQTVPRTINTGLGALFILVGLYLLGGDTLTDFALALIVGILVGTYSSIFVASPLVVTLESGGGGPPVPARPAASTVAPSAKKAAPRPRRPARPKARSRSRKKGR